MFKLYHRSRCKRNFKPVIDRKYPIEKIAEAYTYVASGQKKGNVLIVMDH
jgi:D-arabinose 1-dehydrogenase-like Zn-dependent alcohol dehydrogenase